MPQVHLYQLHGGTLVSVSHGYGEPPVSNVRYSHRITNLHNLCEGYRDYQSENVSVVPFIFGVPGIYTSNLDVVRQVVAAGPNSTFTKPYGSTRALLSVKFNASFRIFLILLFDLLDCGA